MKKIHYLKIHNFKMFGQAVTIELDQPSVLIGPNNSGKTTVIQALSLWHYGLKKWSQEKLNGASVGLNRLEISQVPVSHTRYFWQNLAIREKNKPITMSIAVGVEFQGQVAECTAIFKYSSPEVIYCQPDEKTRQNKALLNYIKDLNIAMLYPISGIITEEPLIQEGRIQVLIGEGKTSEILRNICYQIVETNENDWQSVTYLMKRLFQIDLKKPVYLKARGSIELKYTTPTLKNGLDIAVAGRGQQQMLLFIAYLFLHKETILLLDEPDAHLEILRQRQMLTVLNYLAEKKGNQIIIATHSQVMLENAIDNNLVMLLDGEAINLSKTLPIKNALQNFGIEHYYKAKITQTILYVEGSTDIEMLKAFAELLDHPAKTVLTDKLNYYYVQDTEPVASFEKEIDKVAGYYQDYVQHFYAIKACLPALTGIALFDGDNKGPKNRIKPDLAIVYWKKYELENYFIQPEVIENFVRAYYDKQPLKSAKIKHNMALLKKAINQTILTDILNNDDDAYAAYLKLDKALQKQTFINNAGTKKLSLFLDKVLQKFASLVQQPRLLNKGRYYELIKFMPQQAVDSEVMEKLDLLVKYLKH
ncbi:MAG TPA: AAA family ATPase [Thiotrichaceae bacterium]|nr:AAA family ATPase [Thiotrichaceae bacterium]